VTFDAPLIAKKLSRIEACLRDLTLIDPASIEHDIVRERFAEHTLQIAIQCALDVASHIVAEERLGDADTNHALFDLLARHGWIASEHVAVMHRMVGFRNVLVHEYEDVDVRIVRLVLERHTADLQRFADAVRAKLIP
jgi:uncharacterized protein YutE (UPF0331/DUF86 family)